MFRNRFPSSAGFLHPPGMPSISFCFRARHCSSLAPSAAAKAASLLDANPADPLGVFWRALNDKTLKGPGVAVGIAMDARCGLGREATEQDARGFPSMVRCINPGDTPWTLAALADRTDVLIEMIGADEGTLVPSESEALPAAANEGPIRSGPCAVAKMGLTQLHVAVCKSDWMAVARGCNIGCQDCFDRTALHLAAIKGDVEMVTALVGMGASNTDYDARGFTPLHYAAEMGHADIVQHLTTDESAEAQDMAGRTALYVACERGDVAVVQELVKLGGLSGDREAVGGRRAIHVAAESGNTELVNFLLNPKGNLMYSASNEAEKGGIARVEENNNQRGGAEDDDSSQSKETAEEFINSKDAEGNTPLMLAAKKGHREVFELLVQRGADAKAESSSGWTPLTVAAAHGWTSTVDIISNQASKCVNYTKAHCMAQMKLRDPSDKNFRELTDYLWTALNDRSVDAGFIAAIVEDPLFGLDRLVDLKLGELIVPQKLSNIQERIMSEREEVGTQRCAPMRKALQMEYRVVEARGATPLMLAALTNRVDVMKALLIAGADPLAGYYLSPTEIAAMIGSVEAIKLLHSYGSNIEYQTTKDKYNECFRPVLKRAILNGHVECVKVLLDYGASPTDKHETLNEALICAAATGNTQILLFLIASFPKERQRYINEALKVAVVVGQLDCVTLLLAEGADKELLDFVVHSISYINALYIVTAAGDEDKATEKLDILLNPNTREDEEDNGRIYQYFSCRFNDVAFFDYEDQFDTLEDFENIGTPLHFAAVRGDHAFMEFLLSNGAKPNTVNKVGKTALHCSAQGGHVLCIELLVAKGADINASDNAGWSALHYAVKFCKLDCVGKLIALGAERSPVTKNDDPNRTKKEDNTRQNQRYSPRYEYHDVDEEDEDD